MAYKDPKTGKIMVGDQGRKMTDAGRAQSRRELREHNKERVRALLRALEVHSDNVKLFSAGGDVFSGGRASGRSSAGGASLSPEARREDYTQYAPVHEALTVYVETGARRLHGRRVSERDFFEEFVDILRVCLLRA